MVDASTSMCIFSSMVTETPMRPSNSIMVVTSCKCGTFDTVTGPSASRHPANMGRVAFLAPEILISPSSDMPPWICSLSTPLACEFFRRKHLQRQRMDLVAHRLPQGAIDHLVTLHGALAGESRRDDHSLEMHIVFALDQRLGAGQPRFDDARHLLRTHIYIPQALRAEFNGAEAAPAIRCSLREQLRARPASKVVKLTPNGRMALSDLPQPGYHSRMN